MCKTKNEYTVSENTTKIANAIVSIGEIIPQVEEILASLYGAAADKEGKAFHEAIGCVIASLDAMLIDSVHDNILAGDKKEL